MKLSITGVRKPLTILVATLSTAAAAQVPTPEEGPSGNVDNTSDLSTALAATDIHRELTGREIGDRGPAEALTAGPGPI